MCEVKKSQRTSSYAQAYPTVAIKVDKKGVDKDTMMTLISLNHPNIIKHLDIFVEADLIVIVMEFAAQGDLSDFLRRHGPLRENLKLLYGITVQICLTMKALHASRIVHRDIKPKNIFVDCESESFGIRIKVGDFGSSKLLDEDTMCAKTIVGTPYYLSPEICSLRSYDFKTDVWSFGCVFYELLTNKHPFEGKDIRELVQNIGNHGYKPVDRIEPHAKTFIDALLNKNTSLRPTFPDLFTFEYIKRGCESYLPLNQDSESRRIGQILKSISKRVYSDQSARLAMEELSLLMFGTENGAQVEDVDNFPENLAEKWRLLHRRKKLTVELDRSTDSLSMLNEIKANLKVDTFELEPYHSIDDEEVLAQIPKTLFTKLSRLVSKSIQEKTPLQTVETKILEIIGSTQHDIYLTKKVYGRMVYLYNQRYNKHI